MFGLFKKTKTSEGFNKDFANLAKDIIDTAEKVTAIYIAKRIERKLIDDTFQKLNANDELIFFFLCYLDRSCFNAGGKAAQIKVYEPVALLVFEIIKIHLTDTVVGDILIEDFKTNFKIAEKAYSLCDDWVNNENLERSVLFEASKRIANKGTEEEILLASEVVYLAMKMLNMNEKAKILANKKSYESF